MKRRGPSRPWVKLNRGAVSELLNMSQTQLARLCGISPGYFSLLMAGQRSPSPDVRRRIQEVLGVHDFDRLFIIEPAERSSSGRPATGDGPGPRS